MLMTKNISSNLFELLDLQSPCVSFLAKLEKIDANKKLSLSEFEDLTGSDDFVNQLITFDSNNFGFGEFYEKIVCGKGIPFLRSLVIKLVAEELYDSEYIKGNKSKNLTGFKSCSIRLANFLKKFNDELGESEDDSYLSGLFFRLPTLAEIILEDPAHGFEDNFDNNLDEFLGNSLSEMGFSPFITTMGSDSLKDFQGVTFPLAQALARIGNQAYQKIAKEGRHSLTDWYPDRDMLDVIGLGRRQIFEVIKTQITKS